MTWWQWIMGGIEFLAAWWFTGRVTRKDWVWPKNRQVDRQVYKRYLMEKGKLRATMGPQIDALKEKICVECRCLVSVGTRYHDGWRCQVCSSNQAVSWTADKRNAHWQGWLPVKGTNYYYR